MKGATFWRNSLEPSIREHFWELLSNLMRSLKAKGDLLSDLLGGSFYERPFVKPV